MGGLFHSESIKILELFNIFHNWNEVSQRALESNILQSRTVSTSKRALREIIARLKTLTMDELDLLSNGSVHDQKYLLWLSTCRRYVFIHDFAVEVIRERYLTLKHDLPNEEFDTFYNSKEQWYEELEKIAESTKSKLRNVLFKILREAEIIDANKLILPAMLTNDLIGCIAKHNINDLLIFPISDIDLQKADR